MGVPVAVAGAVYATELCPLRLRGVPHDVYRYDAGHGSLVDDERVRQMRAELDFATQHLTSPPAIPTPS